MTNPTPISSAKLPLPKHRTALMTGRPECRNSNLDLLAKMHARMQRVMLAYANVSEAIVRVIQEAA